MKVLVADKLDQRALDGLAELGCEVKSDPDLKEQALHDALEKTKAEVLIVRSTKVPEGVLDGTNLSLIIRAGSGYNTIAVDAASSRGISVANCPGMNAIAVAELAFGLILSLDRSIPDNVSELRAGRWDKKRFSKGRGLYGGTLGLVGLGNVAQHMVTVGQAFGMNVIAINRFLTPETAACLNIGRAETLGELAQQSDFVSLHIALGPETEELIGRSFFEAMKDGAGLINTSRAGVVVQDELIAAVKSGKIVAGLDVFEGEPSTGQGEYDGEIKDVPGIYCTHHIGASTSQAQEAVAMEAVRIVKEFAATGVAPNVVSVSEGAAATHLLVVRHLDKVGVLAEVLEALSEGSINVQETENVILRQAREVITQMSLDGAPSPDTLLKIRTNVSVFDVNVMPLTKD